MLSSSLWVVFGLASAFATTSMFLLQERFRINGFTLAFWIKITCILAMLPAVAYVGLPTSPLFYIIVSTQAVLWTVADVNLFSNLPKFGAGVTSRILPFAIIATFLAWLPFDPNLIQKYQADPIRLAAIVLILCGITFFAVRLRHCAVSWSAVRAFIPNLLAPILGAIAAKLAMAEAGPQQGPFAFILVEAFTMVCIWALYYKVRKPVPPAVFFEPRAVKISMAIGVIGFTMVTMNLLAVHFADNPAYVSALRQISAILVLLFYKLTKHEDRGDVTAGMGIVICAALLIIATA